MTTEEASTALDCISDALSQNCPLTFADTGSLTIIAGKIQGYIKTLECVPSIEAVIGWAKPLEAALKQKADEQAAAETAQHERIEAKRRERDDWLRPSAADKDQAILDLRERNKQALPVSSFVPARAYTQEEQERMSGGEFGRKILGRHRIEDYNSTSDPSVEGQRQTILKKRFMRSRKSNGSPADRQARSSLRRQILEGLRK